MKLSDIIKLDPISTSKDFVDGPIGLHEIFQQESFEWGFDGIAAVKDIMDDCELRTYADGNPDRDDVGTLVLAAVFCSDQPLVVVSTGGSWGDTEVWIVDPKTYWLKVGQLKAALRPGYEEYNTWDPDMDFNYIFGKVPEVVDNKINLFDPRTRRDTALIVARDWLNDLTVTRLKHVDPALITNDLILLAASNVTAPNLDWSMERTRAGFTATVQNSNEFYDAWNKAFPKKE